MRVLEAQQPGLQLYTMTKKKHKFHKKQQRNADAGASESSDENNATAGNLCKHINKSVNLNSLRKALKLLDTVGDCAECSGGTVGQERSEGGERSEGRDKAEGRERSEGHGAGHLDEEEVTVWMCLQCGHQGCGRGNAAHAVKHYNTPHSVPHSLALNTQTNAIWCYVCDEYTDTEGNKRLQECVELISKKIQPKPDPPQPVLRPKSAPVEREELKRPRSVGSSQVSQSLTDALPKVRGLNNLGNTCFFNAVMQNLSQTHIFEQVLRDQTRKEVSLHLDGGLVRLDKGSDSSGSSEDSDEDSDRKLTLEPLSVSLGECSKLTQSLLGFYSDMTGPSSHNNAFCPSALFAQVCHKAPRFKSFQQQDSHELLRHLLDGIRTEEIKRRQQGILKEFNLTDSSSIKNVNNSTKFKLKEYGRQAKHTFVDQVFGGCFVSTVLCEECKVPSQIYEPFLDISLPITEEKPGRPNIGHQASGGKSSTEKSLGDDLLSSEGKSNRLSKHAIKKAKKESKRKAKLGKMKRLRGQEVKDEEVNEEVEVIGDGQKTTEDEDTISRDADVEDNIENDLSKSRHVGSVSHCETNGLPEDLCIEGHGCSEGPLTNGEKFHHLSNEGRSSRDWQQKGESSSVDLPEGVSSEDSTLKGSVGTATSSDISSRTKVDTESSETHSVCSTGTLESLNGDHHKDEQAITMEMGALGLEENGCLSDGESVTEDGRKCEVSMKALRQQAQLMARTPLAPRHKFTSNECSVMSCLTQFTTAELLMGNNKARCEHCSLSQGKKEGVYTNASKQVLILSPPPVLTLHMKRFQQVGFSLRKVNRHVEFPLVLDLAPFCSQLCQGVSSDRVLYSLYGVVEHGGRLSGGHYTAYVRVRANTAQQTQKFIHNPDMSTSSLDKLIETMHRLAEQGPTQDSGETQEIECPPGKWYYISDSRVSEVRNEANVLRCQAYLLFYERIA